MKNKFAVSPTNHIHIVALLKKPLYFDFNIFFPNCNNVLQCATQIILISVSVNILLMTWPVSIQMSEVVQHESEETGELGTKMREKEKHM